MPDGRTVPVFVLANSQAARRFLLTNPEGYSLTYNGLVMAVEKRRSDGWQAFGSYTFSQGLGAAGLQRERCGGRAGQLGRRRHPADVRTGSEQSHQRARPAAERSPAHVPRHGLGGRPTHRPGGRGQSPAFQRQAVRGVGAADAAAGQPARAARAARLASNCRRNRCSICACRERSPSAAWDASSCSWTCSMRSMTRRRRAWRPTICSARLSVRPPSSWIRVARWSA